MSVFIDGATLSSILYSHVNSEGNQEGVLLGQVVREVKEHISDSQINNSQLHTFTYVASHIPWPTEDRVYSRGGVPIMEKMAALLGDSHTKEEVVGWYSFRRNSTMRMSMKERTLHKHLEARFCPQQAEQFVFLMCVHSCSAQRSTHSVDHFFATLSPGAGTMKKLSVSVTNLGDTVHTQYKTLAHSTATQSSAVQHILHDYRSQFVSSAGDMQEVQRINDMAKAINTNLQRLCQQVSESEQQAGELDREVARLREALAQREQEQQHQRRRRRREAEAQREGEKGDGETCGDPGHLYPTLPAARQAWGEEEEREGGGMEVERATSGSSPMPSVDDLLSLAPTTTALPNPDLSTLTPAPSVPDGQPPPAPVPVLQSVVDTITDVDEEVDVSHHHHPPPPSSSSSPCPQGPGQKGNGAHITSMAAGGSVPHSKVASGSTVHSKVTSGSSVHSKVASGSVHSKVTSGSVHSKVTSGSVHTKVKSGTAGSHQSKKTAGGAKPCVSSSESGGGSSKDHFSFVDNLLSSESGSGLKKSTATVPTGATLTYSPRATRSQVKGTTSAPSVSSSKDRPKASRNSPTRSVTSQPKRENSPKADGKVKATSTTRGGSPSSQGERQQGKGESGSAHERIHQKTALNRDSKLTHGTRQDGSVRGKLDPASFPLGGRAKHRSKELSAKVISKSDSDGEKMDGEPEYMSKNGNIAPALDNQEAPRPSSPVF